MATTLKQMGDKIWEIMPGVGAFELYKGINNSIRRLNSEGFIQEDEVELAVTSGSADITSATYQINSVEEVRYTTGEKLTQRSIEYIDNFSAADDEYYYAQVGNKIHINASYDDSGSITVVAYESLPTYASFAAATEISINEYYIPAIVYLTISEMCQKDKYLNPTKSDRYLVLYNQEIEKLRNIVFKFKEKGYQSNK